MTKAAPRVRMITDLGDVVVELRPDLAPRSVAAFLVEVGAGAYNGGHFWRMVRANNDQGSPTIEVIQGSCVGAVEACADIALESTTETGLRHEDGTISLPRLDGGAGSAQGFFICIGAQPGLDAGSSRTADGLGFAAFGCVISGMEVARAIHNCPNSRGRILGLYERPARRRPADHSSDKPGARCAGRSVA
jgi:peptidyl-prolyl cis-trans isomerase A (cyclophilin A)